MPLAPIQSTLDDPGSGVSSELIRVPAATHKGLPDPLRVNFQCRLASARSGKCVIFPRIPPISTSNVIRPRYLESMGRPTTSPRFTEPEPGTRIVFERLVW